MSNYQKPNPVELEKRQKMEMETNFELLKSLILDEERKDKEILKQDLDQIRDILDDQKFRDLVSPIIRDHLEDLKMKFPDLYGDVVREAISSQIKNQEDEMVNSLYPILGKMVKKFAYSEINKWVEAFDRTFQDIKKDFKNGSLWARIKNFVRVKILKRKGNNEDLTKKIDLLKQQFYNQIEEIFIIEKDTGFILASYSDDGPFKLDQQMMVGLLTAIKSFGEDIMSQKDEGLNTIQFDSYSIIVISFYSYFAATVVNGPITESFKSDLHDKLLDYAKQYLNDMQSKSDLNNEKEMSNALKELIRAE